MADVSVTASAVIGAGQFQTVVSGAAITAGQPVYVANGIASLAKADTAPHAAANGIAVTSAPGAGQPVLVQGGGSITFNACFTKGLVYVVSAANAGGIAPFGDLSSGNYVTILGVALSTTVLSLNINASGIAQ